jgi:bacillithiol system protein YtxJ
MFEFFKSGKDNDANGKSIKIELGHKDQWQEILTLSQENPIFIYKHSSRCGISSVVLSRFEKQISERDDSYYHLHIQAQRELSNWLAEELGIRHESPQLIVIKNEKAIAYDSHYALLDIIPKL